MPKGEGGAPAPPARSTPLQSQNIVSNEDDEVLRRFHAANIAHRYDMCGEPSCRRLAADLPAGRKLSQCSGTYMTSYYSLL